MTIRVDRTKCIGVGLCEMTVPGVFEIGEDGLSHVLDENPTGDVRAAAEEAVFNCPSGALSISER
jgi:ferredoxin